MKDIGDTSRRNLEYPQPEEFTVGSLLMCKSPDGTLRKCKVVERKPLRLSSFSYYVHYAEWDRRMDE